MSFVTGFVGLATLIRTGLFSEGFGAAQIAHDADPSL